jgi:hypothetical protein
VRQRPTTIVFAGGHSYNAPEDITHDCSKEPDVAVNTSGVKATFIGTCDRVALNGSDLTVTFQNVRKLAVNGSDNRVEIDGVDRLAVNGSENKVAYKKGIEDKHPKISNLGTGNKITQK